MNRWQKEARFTLIVMGLALALSLTAVVVLRFVFDFKWHSATAGLAFMALMGLSRVDPSMFRIKSKKPPLDERDLLIKRNAKKCNDSSVLGFLADIRADGDGTVLCVRPEWEGTGDISVLDGLRWYVRGNDPVLDSNIERVRLEG